MTENSDLETALHVVVAAAAAAAAAAVVVGFEPQPLCKLRTRSLLMQLTVCAEGCSKGHEKATVGFCKP